MVLGQAFVLLAVFALTTSFALGASASASGPREVSVPHAVRSGALSIPDPVDRLSPHATAAYRNSLVDAPCTTSNQSEVEQAYDPSTGYLYEEWIGCGGIGFARSTDGGLTFGAAVTVPGTLGNFSWDPAIAISSNGTLVLSYMMGLLSEAPDGGVPYVAVSFDHGASFAYERPVFPSVPTEFSDRDFVAIAPNGTLYVTWDYAPNASLVTILCAASGSCYYGTGDFNAVCAFSSNLGHTWSTPVAIDPEYPWGGALAAPLLVEPNGQVDVLYEDYNTTAKHWLGAEGAQYFSKSLNGGRTWSTPVQVGAKSLANDTWWIDGDLGRDSSGTLYASYDNQNTTTGNDQAWLATSTDDGASWSYLKVSPDVDKAPHIMSVVGAGPGTAFVSWESNNSTRGWGLYLSEVTGNGSSMTPPTDLADQWGINGIWGGDTTGLTYLGKGVCAASWGYGVPATGGSYSQIFSAVYTPVAPEQSLIMSLTPGAWNASLSWIPPSALTATSGYIISLSSSAGVRNITVSSATLQYTLTGLQDQVRYRVNVTAETASGLTLPSPDVSFTLQGWSLLTGVVSPANANLSLNGTAISYTGSSFSYNTTPGPRLLSASASGYQRANQTLDLPWNGTTSVNVALKALAPKPVLQWVNLSATTLNVSTGGLVVLTASPYCTRGCLAVTYNWTENPTLGSFNTTTGRVVNFTAGTTAGVVNVTVTAMMSGKVVSRSLHIDVSKPVPVPCQSCVTTSYTSEYIGLGVVAALIILLVVAFQLRKRKSATPPTENRPTSPAP